MPRFGRDRFRFADGARSSSAIVGSRFDLLIPLSSGGRCARPRRRRARQLLIGPNTFAQRKHANHLGILFLFFQYRQVGDVLLLQG